MAAAPNYAARHALLRRIGERNRAELCDLVADGINAQLSGVMFSRDGDSFGGGGTPATPDDFADLSAEESLVD